MFQTPASNFPREISAVNCKFEKSAEQIGKARRKEWTDIPQEDPVRSEREFSHPGFPGKYSAERRTMQLTSWAVVGCAINFNERAALRLNLINIMVITP